EVNEVEKQELKDLNEKNSNSNFQEDEEKNDDVEKVKRKVFPNNTTNDNVEGINDDAEEIIDDVEEMNDDAENQEDPETDEPKIPIKVVKNSNGKWSIKKTPLKKVKNFPCKICANKSYTTRRSLQRHNNSFHVKKHSIKEAEVIPEVIHPKTTSPDTAKSEERKNLKRKHQYHQGEFHLEKDNQKFSRDEPVVKRRKGADSETPRREKVKRKHQDDTNDSKKKFIWESY
ncbi:MAG: hypothetical protein GY707_07845, partial [Desulfobacteraceae bacterium]|nr:hypothetical protein [Desulfobacteraceae bacterium]